MEAPRLPGIGEQNGQRSEHAIRQIALQLKNDYAPLVSPVLTGNPQAPTPAADDNSTSIATTEYVQTELADYATSTDLSGAIAQEVTDRDAAIAAAAYSPPTIADKRIMANYSGSTAAPAATTSGTIFDDQLGATRGMVPYRSNSAWTALAPGTAGQLLQTQGSGADPTWVTFPQRVTSIVKTADEGRASGTTLAADSVLLLPVEASTTYLVEALLFYTAGGGNIQAGLSGPSGATGVIINEFSIGAGSGSSVGLGVQAVSGNNTTAGTMAVAFRGTLTVSTTAGDATIVWGRGSASGTTNVKAGAYLKLIKVGA